MITKFTIKRSDWLRGKGTVNSALLHSSNNQMCCLGFYSLAFGFTKEEIYGKTCPLDMDTEIQDKYPDYIFNEKRDNHSNIISELMFINDNCRLSENDREKRITENFNSLGITVTFED